MPNVSWKDIFEGFQYTAFKNNLTFMKKAVIHTTTLMHCKSRQVLRDLFSTDQGNGSEMTFTAEATKINLENSKT